MPTAGHNFDYERAARALAIAALHGIKEAANAEGITVRTVRNYRQRLDQDEYLAELFREKKESLEREWASELAPAIRGAIDFLRRASSEANPADPEAIHSVAGALKILTGVALTKEVLDARLAAERRSRDPALGQVATA